MPFPEVSLRPIVAARHVFHSNAGPGWFDSSWELRQGLEVCEGNTADMPLQHWLDAFLRQPPAAAAR